MYIEYNPHPNGKLVGDCVKRALTKASGKTYQEVSNELNRIKRAIGASAYNSNKVWTKYVTENLGGVYKSFPAEKGKPRMNGQRFCESYPVGTFVLRMAGHLSCCVDGVIYDTWNCLDKCVYGAYLIEKDASTTPKMMPMPGIEKLANLKSEYPVSTKRVASAPPVEHLDGDELIDRYYVMTGSPVKETKAGEQWISLTQEGYADVLADLLSRKYLRCTTRRGSKKSTWYDEKTGMEIILKSGDKPYVWCTKVGTK